MQDALFPYSLTLILSSADSAKSRIHCVFCIWSRFRDIRQIAIYRSISPSCLRHLLVELLNPVSLATIDFIEVKGFICCYKPHRNRSPRLRVLRRKQSPVWICPLDGRPVMISALEYLAPGSGANPNPPLQTPNNVMQTSQAQAVACTTFANPDRPAGGPERPRLAPERPHRTGPSGPVHLIIIGVISNA